MQRRLQQLQSSSENSRQLVAGDGGCGVLVNGFAVWVHVG
jgi:hypothetical protein